jgi:hypothetical protein
MHYNRGREEKHRGCAEAEGRREGSLTGRGHFIWLINLAAPPAVFDSSSSAWRPPAA